MSPSADSHGTAPEDTITAIATPPGAGGIGIIRISGAHSTAILDRLFKARRFPGPPAPELESHRFYYGWIIDPDNETVLDEVLAVSMHAPHTYTREDVVEIHCHGSYLALQRILALVINSGARLAQPGEFTKRAFVNGRIDLTRAEAVMDLIEAKTDAGLSLAASQLLGGIQEQVQTVRDELISLLALLEVALDFPEEDEEILPAHDLMDRLHEKVLSPLDKLIAGAERGRLFRRGISAVILGRPNVGKSSLLNRLLREDRALVTPVPGTTRDTIEEYISIRGVPVRLVDTAGLRDDPETVEEMGIQRARAKLADADLALLLLDAVDGVTEEDKRIYRAIREGNGTDKIILVLNKTDLATEIDYGLSQRAFGREPLVSISALTGTGIDDLEETIFRAITSTASGLTEPDTGCAPNLRHKAALEKAREAVNRLAAGVEQELPADLLAVELQTALDHLGGIVGATTTEDVLDVIFDRFCIGK